MVSFQAPWLLLLALLPFLAWWLLRVPRKGAWRVTYRLEIWIRAARELKLLEPRGHFLRDLPLLAGLLLLCLVPSGPRWGARKGPDTLLVVLDRSPSMGASTAPGGKTRFQAALDRLAACMKRIPPDTEVRLLGTGGRNFFRGGGRAGDFETWISRAAAWGPASRGRARLSEVLAGISPLGLPILVLSDLAGPEKGAVKAAERGVLFSRVGAPFGNGVLLDGRLLSSWPAPEVKARFLLGGALQGRSLLVRPQGGGKVLARLDLSKALQGGKGRPRGPFQVDLAWPRRAGPVRVSLDPPDRFAWDDVLLLDPPPAPALRVALGAPLPPEGAAPPVRSILRGLTAGRGKVVGQGENPDLVVVQGGSLPGPPGLDGRGKGPSWLLLGTRVKGVTGPGWIHAPQVGAWDMEHPLLRGLDLSQLGIRLALSAREGGTAGRALVRTVKGKPLLLVREGPPRVVHLLFPVGRSTLGAQLLLPRFVHRCLAWFSGIDPEGRPALRPGGGRPDPEESDLSAAPQPPARPLPAFGLPGKALAPWFLLFALACLALWVFLAPSSRREET